MKNIFIVGSPLQLLNAIEAKYFFGGEENILIMKHFKDPRNNQPMEALLVMANWSKIIHLKHYGFKRTLLNDFYQLRKILKEYVKYDKLFIGDYTPINVRIFAANIAANEVFLLDDGMVSIHIQKNYLHSNLPYIHNNLEDTLKRFVAKWIFGLENRIKEKIHLFTCFSLLPYPWQKVIKNDYSFLKSIIEKQNQQVVEKEKIFFIGAPLVEERIVSVDYFMKMMKKIKLYYDNKEIIYIPHRHESVGKLHIIDNIPGFDIIRMDNIIEISFVKKKIIPSHIASFYSTSLTTLSHLYLHCKADAFLISMHEVNFRNKKTLKGCYEYLNEYVNVIDLNL